MGTSRVGSNTCEYPRNTSWHFWNITSGILAYAPMGVAAFRTWLTVGSDLGGMSRSINVAVVGVVLRRHGAAWRQLFGNEGGVGFTSG